MTEKEFSSYIRANQEENLDLLSHLSHKNVLLLVTGAMRVGKTTMFEQLYKKIKKDREVVRLSLKAPFNSDDLFKKIAEHFGSLEHSINETDINKKLRGQLLHLYKTEQSCVFIIDDAQYLNYEALQVIFEFIKLQEKKYVCMNFILFSETELYDHITNIVVKRKEKNNVYHLSLHPLNLKETENYLKQSRFVENKKTKIFSKKIVTQIYKLSSGYPGRVNRVVAQCLKPKEDKTDCYMSKRKCSFRILAISTVFISTIFLCAFFVSYQFNQIQKPFTLTMFSDAHQQNVSHYSSSTGENFKMFYKQKNLSLALFLNFKKIHRTFLIKRERLFSKIVFLPKMEKTFSTMPLDFLIGLNDDKKKIKNDFILARENTFFVNSTHNESKTTT